MRLLKVVCVMAALAGSARAEVIGFQVKSVDSPALEGRAFGAAGAYEKVTGKVTVALDPADPKNAVIADIALAPRDAQGKVEVSADVTILRPKDPAKGSGTLFYEVVNRGRKLGPGLFDDSVQGGSRLTKAGDIGDGFLLDRGYTLVWSGWQADFEAKGDELGIDAPTLKGVTGPAREEFIFDNLKNPAVATLAWPAADPASAKVTVRAKATDERQTPADLSFRFVDPTHVEITRPNGFDAGALYEITYTARDPKVLGVGFAVTRDLVAWLRHDASAANPLAGRRYGHALAYGSSQSGRYLREFLYLGFNQDTANRQVFDGMLVHIAGARMTFVNARFGQPGRNSRHLTDPAYLADRFPFTYETETDPISGAKDGILARCTATRTCPKVIQSDSEHEWWASRASLLVTDPTGKPMAPPANVRLFMVAGTPHMAPFEARMSVDPKCQMPMNPMHGGPALRAFLVDLDEWVAKGTEPPPSRTPNLADGTLVKAEAGGPPAPIPGEPYRGVHTRAYLMDWSSFPPKARGEYVTYVPRLDADGMAAGGVHLPAIAAPKATYTGWNPRSPGFGPDSFCALQGGVLPFAATRAEREAAHDPRPSLEERYPTQASYVAAVRTASERLAKERLLLTVDIDKQVKAAEADQLAKLKPLPKP